MIKIIINSQCKNIEQSVSFRFLENSGEFAVQLDISENKLGFKPVESCINQLLSITHGIYQSSDDDWKLVFGA